MADFAFYRDVYLGSAIPEKAFREMAHRAREILDRFCRIYQVNAEGEDSRKMAVCAMAESLYTHSKHRGGITAVSVGEVSVRYEGSLQSDRMLGRELYEKASIYLDFYRGVGA